MNKDDIIKSVIVNRKKVGIYLKKLLNKNGLTLIEIIITLAVMGVVIVPLMSMFITSQKINNESSKEYDRLQVAQKFFEEIKSNNKKDKLVDDLGYIHNATIDEFNYNNGSYKYETSDQKTYDVNVDIKKSASNSSSAATVFDSTINIIYDTNAPEQISAIGSEIKVETKDPNSSLNLTTKNGEIIINGSSFSVGGTSKIKIELESKDAVLKTDVTLNFTNNENISTLYIFDDGNKCNVKSTGGKVPKIGRRTTSQDILYDVLIKINAKDVLKGTIVLY